MNPVGSLVIGFMAVVRHSRRAILSALIVGTWLSVAAPVRAAEGSLDAKRPQIVLLLQQKLPEIRPEVSEKAARDFLDHLQRTSPIAAQNLASDQMDNDELSSRVDVYVSDHPELTGQAPVAYSDPRRRVAALLAGEAGVGQTEAERLAAADRFIDRLGQLSGEARDSLMTGRMPDEELASRVKVFTADLRSEAAAAAVDPLVAGVPAIVEAFEKANLGVASDRPNSICFRGTVDEGGKVRSFEAFKKRPAKIRIHILEEGELAGILGYDGTTAWRQSRGQPAIPITGSDSDSLVTSARFDDPLVDYREAGTEVRLEDKPDGKAIRLHLRETTGREMVATLDPTTYEERSLRTKLADGTWQETVFKDYRKVGTTNVAFEQQEWRDGKLRSTTKITDVRVDPGLVDRFFTMPSEPYLGFVDFMTIVAQADAIQKAKADVPGKAAQ